MTSAAKFTGRREDFRLVTGQGLYTADWNFEDQAYGQFLRSNYAHAEIVSITVEEALKSPGIICILTGKDTAEAGLKNPLPMTHMKGKGGAALKHPPRPPLAHGRVRFVGEPVAFVVAESESAALDAIEKIAIEYRELPAVMDYEAALKPGTQVLHGEADGNLAMEYELGNAQATDAAFASAKHVVKLTLDAQRISGNPMEPKAGLAKYDAKSGIYDVYMPTQGMSDVRNGLAFSIGVPPDQVRVHARDVGGAFGVRNEAYPEYIALLLAAKRAGRPVKWVGSRNESILSDHHGRGTLMTSELALDEQGNFLGMRGDWISDLGAYCSGAGPFISTAAAPTGMAVNAYKTPALYGNIKLAFTNATPTTAYRGASRPSVAYIVERLVDEAARITGIDRIKLRRRNLIAKKSFPYKTPSGSTYDSGDPAGLLDLALKESDWAGFEKRRKEAKKRGKLRGIGCAAFIEPSGGLGQEEIAIKFNMDGLIDLFSLCGPSGQGHETAFPDLVAAVLGIGSDRIRLRYSDPDGPQLVGTGSFGSRSLISHGGALTVGAREVVKKGLDLAAKEMEVAASDVEFADGNYRVRGTDVKISFEQLAKKYAGEKDHPLDTTMKINTAATYAGGAHVCEVEVDPDTGEIELLSYIAADDCGVVMNHTLVEGQMHGGIMQAIGQAFGEKCVYDPDSGQMLNGTFMDYVMPRAWDLPRIALYDHSTPSPNNPLGVKGAGEAGTTGAIPCIANAVFDALRPLGIHHLDMPYTSNRVWDAIQAAQAK
jgi:carbon-monoxide dehydrogenase large subunit